MILWFGVGFNMKVALAVFSTMFVAFSQAFRGATSVGQEYIDHMLGMRATKAQIFRKIVVPGSLEWVFSSMRLNVGFALLGAFIGEFIASSSGLGYVILRASSLYNVPRAIAAAVGVVILGLVFDYLGSLVERKRLTIIQVVTVPRVIWKS
jgi:NitT/TauT family transport system permease protein